MPEVSPGDDLAALVCAAAPPLHDGDVVVVTSKVVSKAEGRVLVADRLAAIRAETVRVVARRGPTTIARTRHGLTLAAAGVDASNVEPGRVVLL
ncbi:MAG: coenzyme F420-0:L-glutamate ligase, partial [Actinomycetota bacterium]|nr:coenzyme F420-0:L-glutamate ligase [Actinomycetota bacterium]